MIKFVDVKKTYLNGVQALKGINLEIHDGEFVAIIGLSGAGKSTLLRSINKMIDITSGELFIDDVEVGSIKGKELRMLRRSIGMIFQSFNLVRRMSVFNNVISGRVAYHSTLKTIFGLFPAQEKLLALESLDAMGILDKAFTRADQLSGGQQQRVAIARAVVSSPGLILADEPTGNLDSKNGFEVMNLLTELNQEGATILMVTHSDRDAGFAHRTINLLDGQVIVEMKN